MSDLPAIISQDQQMVTFYNEELIAVRGDDGQIYASLSQMCKNLGLRTPSQVKRIKRHEVLLDGYRKGRVMTKGGGQTVGMLRVDLIPLWLSGISAEKVNPEIKSKLIKYQKQAAKVLNEAFQQGRLQSDIDFEQLLNSNSPAAQAYKMMEGMMLLARQQLLLESRLDNHENRLEQIEATLGNPNRHISPAQAVQISQAVKGIAMELSSRSGKNEYGGVYGEFYRQFEITSYKHLSEGKFNDAIAFLNEWYQGIVGDGEF